MDAQGKYKIYRHVDPRDSVVFYVGLTGNLQGRFKQHLACDGTNPQKDARIQAIIAAGLLPLQEIIDQADEEEQARRLEAYWINFYLQDEKAELTNIVIPPEEKRKARRPGWKFWSTGLPEGSQALDDINELCAETGMSRSEATRFILSVWSKAKRQQEKQSGTALSDPWEPVKVTRLVTVPISNIPPKRKRSF